MTLKELHTIHKYGTDKLGEHPINKHDYVTSYERHFGPLRHLPLMFWEIGVMEGESVRMWCDYASAWTVVGIDKVLPRKAVRRSNGVFEEGDATDPKFIEELLRTYGPPDVVLDDGSHIASEMNKAFDLLYCHTKIVYAVEDLGTQYREEYGDLHLDDEPFTDRVKKRCDLIARDRAMERICWEPAIVFIYPGRESLTPPPTPTVS